MKHNVYTVSEDGRIVIDGVPHTLAEAREFKDKILTEVCALEVLAGSRGFSHSDLHEKTQESRGHAFTDWVRRCLRS
ncbi:hypothetical protein M0R72_00655 [Candidatus Pacearchaeota archaeon]|jgi:hypothetical protein|nr:hypothetical protein [Candidatus Pacearchaeota archaeon]